MSVRDSGGVTPAEYEDFSVKRESITSVSFYVGKYIDYEHEFLELVESALDAIRPILDVQIRFSRTSCSSFTRFDEETEEFVKEWWLKYPADSMSWTILAEYDGRELHLYLDKIKKVRE